MFSSPAELLAKITLGEDTFLELKEVRCEGTRLTGPHRDSLADECAAFANSTGGVLVLGVDDKSRAISGIPLEFLDRVEDLVREACCDRVEPPLAPIIERLTLSEVAVIRVELRRSLFVHRSPSGYLHRVGSAKRQMPPDFLARLFQQRSQSRLIRFDEQVVSQARLEDLAPGLWERFRTSRSTGPPEQLLSKLGMADRDEEGQWRPTVAGVLLASEDPRVFLPNAYIQAVAYTGTTVVPEPGAYQLDAADISGPLDAQVAYAHRFVMRNMRTAAVKSVGRTDYPQYDATAVFEALVNAVAHRDYSIHGSKIRLRLFADRLELYVPGALTNTMTVESLPLRQSVRNEAVTSLLARCVVPADLPGLTTDRATLMDRRGEGVALILERSQAVYQVIDDAELLLTLYAATPPVTSSPPGSS